MGRLFWKFFFFISLSQLVAILGVTASFWLEHHNSDKMRANLDKNFTANSLMESAATTLQYGGAQALRSLLENQAPPLLVYAVDEQSTELLGRQIEPKTLEQAQSRLETDPACRSVKRIKASDGHTYLLYLPLLESWPNGDHPPNEDRPPNGDHPPNGFHIPFEPIVAALLASLAFAALLARYFSTPIRNLRSAFEAATTGNLDVRLGAIMGKRRDELADLGRHFDLMADHLRSLMDVQRRLLHDVSHELRSPLARLQAAIGLTRQQPEKLESYLDRIEREGVRMDKLVGELLTISRLEAGVMSSMDEEVDLDVLLSEVVSDARFEASDSGHSMDFLDGIESIIKGNVELLHRAIENVVRNAIRHTPAGSKITIEAILIGNASRVLVRISDQGPGIPEDDLDSIFDPFFRGSGNRQSDGHGLGLAIARRVVQAHGGTISASNRRGGGLCIEIVLPIKLP